MLSPSPRQQAGYLRRLLRRGEIQIFDTASGRPVQAMIELVEETVRITPVLPRRNPTPQCESDAHWLELIERFRAVLSLQDAEELLSAVEAEQRKSKLLSEFSR